MAVAWRPRLLAHDRRELATPTLRATHNPVQGQAVKLLRRPANGSTVFIVLRVSTRSDLRSLSGEAQAAIRERAVRAVIGGMSHREAARVFGVERAVVSKWMRRWRDGGWEGLQERRRAGGRVSRRP